MNLIPRCNDITGILPNTNVAWIITVWPHLKGSVLDHHKFMVMVVAEKWPSKHCGLDDVNSLTLRKP